LTQKLDGQSVSPTQLFRSQRITAGRVAGQTKSNGQSAVVLHGRARQRWSGSHTWSDVQSAPVMQPRWHTVAALQ
jgi:hypothetical protein